MSIENDRLKNTLTILNQKLKVANDENGQLKNDIETFKKDIAARDSKIDMLNESRAQLQQELSDFNEKYIGLEKELFESKNI